MLSIYFAVCSNFNVFARLVCVWYVYICSSSFLRPSPQSLMETFLNIRVIVSGDRIRSRERNVIMMNHRTRLDWMYFWSVLVRQSGVATQKIILKSALKHIPGAGGSRWGSWAGEARRDTFPGLMGQGGARRDTFLGQVPANLPTFENPKRVD